MLKTDRWASRTPLIIASWATAFLIATAPTLAAEPAEGTAGGEAHHGKSADEVAKELANPNNVFAKLTMKNQFRWYKGDLPDANDQFNYTMLFQPVFPFPLGTTKSGGKAVFFLRPAVPFIAVQPLPTLRGGDIDFKHRTGLGDIGFDSAVGVTEKNGFLWAAGLFGSLPTATDNDLASGQLRLGPEVLFAKIEKWGLYGVFPAHLWNVTGWKDKNYSNTQLQFFLQFFAGNGWVVGTTPIMNYDWEHGQWTIPLQLIVSKTVQAGGTPLKIEVEMNYYVEQADAFGPAAMLGINLTPVVPNYIYNGIRDLF